MPKSPESRYLVIHGHFYQPPRENPWIEEIEYQGSASPFHDWNERISAECYGPNTAARIVGVTGGVTSIVNNYGKISFNVGPTLMSWLERWAPTTYRKILEADRQSAQARGGHGNAIAQAYNHMILPLANRRDRETQIRWGIADFRRRFGREPRGMWLPECAADEDTLACLLDEGIRFTVLAPQQARRFRDRSAARSGAWQAGIDPRRPYLVELPRGRSIAVFFFDGGVAHDISFGRALFDSDAFVARLLAAYGEAASAPENGAWLVNVATDGETFGHHRPFGDMTLAAAIARVEREGAVRLTNYAAYLELHPPQHVAELHAPSSWSCAHGVSRWRDDCGCATGSRPGWHQRWRRPLRDALDELRERLVAAYERRAPALLRDPWAARNAYVGVLADRTPETIDRFLAEHGAHRLDPLERVTALRLLELQRHAMLMYTSCGWFFSELSGPESVQVLKYAARAIQLAREVDGVNLEPAFHTALARAPSNLPEYGTGGRILDQLVRPSVVNLGGVVAHFAVSSLFEQYPRQGRIFCYGYDAGDVTRRSRGATTLVLGHVRLASDVTGEATDASFAVLHFGGHDVRCAVGAYTDLASWEDTKAELVGLFESASVGDVVRAVDRHFAGRQYALQDLFLDERRKIVRVLVGDILARHHAQLFGVYEENRPLLRFLVENHLPVPGPLRAGADYALSTRFVELIAEAQFGAARFDAAREELDRVREEARTLGVPLDLAEARRLLERRILDEARALSATPRRDTARALLSYLETAEQLGLAPSLWEAQNLYWSLDPAAQPESDLGDDLLIRLGVRIGFDERALVARFRPEAARDEPEAGADEPAPSGAGPGEPGAGPGEPEDGPDPARSQGEEPRVAS